MELRKIVTKLIGKDDIFKILALGEALKLPVLLLGEPGTGKTQSLLDYAAAKFNYNKDLVRNNTFVIELDEGTKTSEIKGKVNMKSLLEDKKYEVDAPIVNAKYVLINEVDKGTSGVRNTLLSIMRERAIFYGSEVKKCQWDVLAGSCNTIPDDELENPFWDRFVLTVKVDRVGVEGVKNIWAQKGAKNLDVKVPTLDEICAEVIDKGKAFKFLDSIYDAVSDRTATFAPMIAKAIKVIYEVDDNEALMKACELTAPTKLTELATKLESKRENNLRTSINELEGVLEGGNDSYSQNYVGQIITDLKEMGGMRSYKNKAKELANELINVVELSDPGTRWLTDFVSEKFCNNTDGLFPEVCERLESITIEA
jgi:MoxR-like ATPase